VTVDAWCAEYATSREAHLRERIVVAHQWLVHTCARQMRRRDEGLDDLAQVANIGLLYAIDRFDPDFGVSFHTYASATILGELRKHYRSTWRVRVPRRLQERHLAVRGALDELTAQLGRHPTMEELGVHLHLEVKEVIEAFAIGGAGWMSELPEADSLRADEPADVVDHIAIDALLDQLPSRDRCILLQWLIAGYSQKEVGDVFGMTQVQVSRSVRGSLQMMRTALTNIGGRAGSPVAGAGQSR